MEFDNTDFFTSIANQTGSPEELEKINQELAEFKQISIEIVKMSETFGWKYIVEKLEELEKLNRLSPEFYAQDPNLAHKHTGALQVIQSVKTYPDVCKQFLTNYDKE